MVVGSVETVMLSLAMDCVLVEGYITRNKVLLILNIALKLIA